MIRKFLTIESVRVESITGDGKIYGEIVIHDFNARSVYRRTINKPETKLAGDFLSLTADPFAGLSDKWSIFVSLYDGDDHHDIAVGGIYVDTVPVSFAYDRSLKRSSAASSGPVRYNYLYRAVLASVEVALPEEAARGESGAARVYGTVRARQYLGDEEGWTEVTLFGRSAGESVAVVEGGLVPMDRCLVGVPAWSYISVEVELSLAGEGIGCGDELLASGSVDFDKENGERRVCEEIEGGGGRKVRVSIHIQAE